MVGSCLGGRGGAISDSKTLKGFFTPAGQSEGCPNRPGGRLVIQKPLWVFSPLRGSPKAVQIVLEDD